MIKHTFFLFLLVAIPYAGLAQDTDCSRFKNGKFRLTDPKTKRVCIITRDGDKQIEKMEDAEESYEFDIKWVDDCTYTVTPTPLTIEKNKDILKMGTMTVKITKVKDSSYVQTVRLANSPKFKRTDQVLLVRDSKQ